VNIKIAIADDHPLVIGGLQNVLHRYSHIQLVNTYSNGTELLAGLEITLPDVLLLDIQLPGQTGDELAPLILKNYPDIKILVLTNFDSSLYVNNMFRHGVHGYLLKTANEKVLIRAIEDVYNGEQFIDDEMKVKLQRTALRIEKRKFSKSNLTPREKEILQLLVNGNTCPEIAKTLFLSVTTVVNYRASIMMKLEVNNTAAMVKKSLQLGLAK